MDATGKQLLLKWCDIWILIENIPVGYGGIHKLRIMHSIGSEKSLQLRFADDPTLHL